MNLIRMWQSILVASALLFLTVSGSMASVSSLDSDPIGMYVSIRGAASLSGSPPLPIGDLPVGEYSLAAVKFGMPVAKGRFIRSDKGISSRPWAGPSALLLPPGIALARRGEKRGWIFLGAGVGSASMSLIAQSRVKTSGHDRDAAAEAYSRATSEQDIQNARINLDAADQKKKDWQKVRNLWIGYLAYTWVGAGVEAVLLTPQPSLATSGDGKYVVTCPRGDGWGVSLRSALVPGEGQRYMGHNGKGNFFAAATGVLGAGVLVAHEKFLDARRDQSVAQARFDHATTDLETSQARKALQEAAGKTDRRSLLQWSIAGAAAGVYIWNLIDSLGLGQGAASPSVTMSMIPSPGGVLIGARWSIQ